MRTKQTPVKPPPRCKTLKAYKVSCRDDDHGASIEFGYRASDIDRRSNSESCDCEFIDRYIARAKAFDKYAPGPIKVADYLREGWYWECSGCSDTCHADDNPLIADDDSVYCDRECAERALEQWSKYGPDAHESILKAAAAVVRLLKSNPQTARPTCNQR